MQNFLQSLSGTFYLTGSRYFGNHVPNSDYDYFTTSIGHNTDLLTTLKRVGFITISDINYKDDSLVNLFQWKSSDGSIIQIQIVRDAKLKNIIQQQIKNNKILLNTLISLDKANRNEVWNFCFSLSTSVKSLK